MKMNYPAKTAKSSRTALIFAAVILSITIPIANIAAQEINKDLVPRTNTPAAVTPKKRPVKANVPKPVTPRPPRNPLPVVPKRRPTVKPALPSSNPVTTKLTTTPPVTPKSQPTPLPTPPVVATVQPTPETTSVTMQTPAQIIERYTNFQQTDSVTVDDWQSVVKQNTVVLQSDPSNAVARAQLLVAQAQIAYSRKDYSTALVQFNAAAKVLPESALPVYGIGKVYLDTKQPNEAQNAFDRAISLNKDFALAYKGMGDAFTARGQAKKAKRYYEQAGEVGAATIKQTGANNSTTPETQANPMGGNGSEGPKKTAFDLELENVRSLMERKRWQAAIDKLTALSENNPNVIVFIYTGDCYYGLGQLLSAQQAYRKATEIDANSALGYYKLGVALFDLNEFQASSDALEKSLILDQSGAFINRVRTRDLADKASKKAKRR